MRFQVHQNGQNCKSEAKEALRPLFNATVKGLSSEGELQHKFKIGVGANAATVCRTAWARAFNISHHMLDSLAQEYKSGQLGAKSRALNDHSHSCKDYHSAMNKLQLVTDNPSKYLAGMILPNTDASKEAYYWFKEYFEICGDHMPNSNEIHLESQDKIEIYEVYKRECLHKFHYTHWDWLWTNLYPHVKIRVYKQVRKHIVLI